MAQPGVTPKHNAASGRAHHRRREPRPALTDGDDRHHLSEHHGDCCPGSAVRIHTTGIEDYQKDLRSKDYKNARPEIEEMPWGKDMSVSDPFGNRLIFTDATTAV